MSLAPVAATGPVGPVTSVTSVVVVAPPAPASPLTASQKRAQAPGFAQMWSWAALAPQLPLLFPVDPTLPPSPKRRYRSHYRPPAPPDPATPPDRVRWATMSDFELALELIDFSPLERVLAAHYYVPSAKGQAPFDPVSLFLCVCWHREQRRGWRQAANLLAHAEDGQGWRRRFGFTLGQTPSASGLRHFFHRVGPAVFAALCPQSITLLRQHHLFPERSTFPGDPPTRGITVTQDGMLHHARHRPSCQLATDTCYHPLSAGPAAPAAAAAPSAAPPAGLASSGTGHAGDGGAPAANANASANASANANASASSGSGDTREPPRPCRARERGREGCACSSPACQAACGRASRLDPEARFIHYAGHNQGPAAGAAPAAPAGTGKARHAGGGKGTDVFGYRSVAERVLDDRFAVAWTLQSTLYPANTDERTIFVDRVRALTATFPDLVVGEWLDDAGVGYGDCLDAIWALGALRMVDVRADPSDRDPAACLARGYDGQGRPLCPHGYPLRANGYDGERRRAKYVCAQACTREPVRPGEPVAAVAGCPYLAPRDGAGPAAGGAAGGEAPRAATCGLVVNVGRTLPDGSLRLARELPYGSPAWQARYGRRNLAESRNGQVERLGLKRLPTYGRSRGTKEVHLADFLLNLRTLGRLVREATALATATAMATASPAAAA